jgi:hypothetical protein
LVSKREKYFLFPAIIWYETIDFTDMLHFFVCYRSIPNLMKVLVPITAHLFIHLVAYSNNSGQVANEDFYNKFLNKKNCKSAGTLDLIVWPYK